MYRITLQGPETTLTAETSNYEMYTRFVKWLHEYNPTKGDVDIDAYPIASEKRLIACRTKARRIGLTA